MLGDQLPEKPALQKATKVLEQNKRPTNDTLFSDEDESTATSFFIETPIRERMSPAAFLFIDSC